MATPAMPSPVPPQRQHSTRPYAAHVYKPAGVKKVQIGIPWVDGASTVVSSKIDLALPIRGLRIIFTGRLVIGVADFTSMNPEGLLNLIANMNLQGTNSRQNGNVTLWDIDLATAWVLPHLFARRAGFFRINGVEVPSPTTPFPAIGASGYASKTQGTYDFEIGVDLPFHPFKAPKEIRPGYLVRQEEWKDTLALSFKFGTQPGAGATGSLGVSAGGTTVAFHAFGSGAGNPTVDVYSLPVQMGAIKNFVLPGVCSRIQRPMSTILQSAGSGASLAQLQRQRTSRVYLKTGTVATAAPAFDTLSDTNVTTLGLATGGSTKSVRPLVDIRAYKQNQSADYERETIQGYTCLDFIESGNPDSAYQANVPSVVGDGTSFELIGDVVGVANAYGLAIQEQILHSHTGALYAS